LRSFADYTDPLDIKAIKSMSTTYTQNEMRFRISHRYTDGLSL
jgi:hypothetical protein